VGSSGDWLEDGGAIQTEQGYGFGWKHGQKRDTTGIWMLDTPIIKKLPDGRKVALLLVDTQGTFDNQMTAETNAMMFALNSLLSSFQVYVDHFPAFVSLFSSNFTDFLSSNFMQLDRASAVAKESWFDDTYVHLK
jgi:hypothetical protein